VPEPSAVQASLTLSGTTMHVQHVEECPDLGPICASQPQRPYQHDQHLYSTDLVLDAELGIVRHLSAEVIWGFRQVTDRIRYLDLAGQPYTPPVPDYHHRNETLFGPTDPWLLLHGGLNLARFTLSAKGGLTLPVGQTQPNPFRLGRLGLPHEHIQFGTGTFDPVAGLELERTFDRFSLSAWTLDRFTLGTDAYGYQSGHKLLGGVTGKSGLGLQHWSFSGGLDVFRETPERWDGVIEQEGNLGRTDLLLDVAASWIFARPWTLTFGAKVPLYSAVQGEQTTYPAILNVGVASSLEAAELAR
jgi:hypothetical protein